jgi:predicted DNA-binding WGR domain protein
VSAVQLRRVDPAKNMARFYLLDVQQDLFGQWWFVREFGRIGAAGTIKLDLFSTEAEAQSRGTEAPREGAARLCSITTP